jgi:hypothetical protein
MVHKHKGWNVLVGPFLFLVSHIAGYASFAFDRGRGARLSLKLRSLCIALSDLVQTSRILTQPLLSSLLLSALPRAPSMNMDAVCVDPAALAWL